MKVCDNLLEKLPEDIDFDDIASRNEGDSSPLKIVLLQEIERSTVAYEFYCLPVVCSDIISCCGRFACQSTN